MKNEELREAHQRLKWFHELLRDNPPPNMQESEKERLLEEYVTLTKTLMSEIQARGVEVESIRAPEGARVLFDLEGTVASLLR